MDEYNAEIDFCIVSLGYTALATINLLNEKIAC